MASSTRCNSSTVRKPDRLGETVKVNGGELVAHDQGRLVGDGDGRPEAGLACAGARERDDPGAEVEPVRLQDDGEPAASLLVAAAACWQPVDLTAHAARPSLLDRPDLSQVGRVILAGVRFGGSDLSAFVAAHRRESGEDYLVGALAPRGSELEEQVTGAGLDLDGGGACHARQSAAGRRLVRLEVPHERSVRRFCRCTIRTRRAGRMDQPHRTVATTRRTHRRRARASAVSRRRTAPCVMSRRRATHSYGGPSTRLRRAEGTAAISGEPGPRRRGRRTEEGKRDDAPPHHERGQPARTARCG